MSQLSRIGSRILAATRRNGITVHHKCLSSFVIGEQKKTPSYAPSSNKINTFLHYRCLSTETASNPSTDSSDGVQTGRTEHEFQAETRMLLDIVARSLYSDKEVFIRELISNANDALEKFRYYLLTSEAGPNDAAEKTDRTLAIHISADKQNRILTITDTGVGMTRDELLSNLGVIARSGSKAFINELKGSNKIENASNIIGQFGVGFYSVFMVADKVEVESKSTKDVQGHKWTSDGSGTYTIEPAPNAEFGTKITIHLKPECREYSDDATLLDVINKYSSFVGNPVFLNGKQANTMKPLWLMDPKSITPQQHAEFYRYISGSPDLPRYTLHYRTDVPLTINALLYFPEGKPGLFEMSRETETGVALYTRKVLIKNRTDNILPKWLRFVKGVVDSDDIPLNLSRELLQNSALIRKLSNVLTARVIKFLLDEDSKRPEEYLKFYSDYGLFLKEGIIVNHDQQEKEEIAKLLKFDSSHKQEGQKIGLLDYISRLGSQDRTIFYLAAPSRQLAEASPYYESLKSRSQEVLFCYEPYDELVLMTLQQFQGYKLVSVEKDMRDDKSAADLSNLDENALKRSEIEEVTNFMKDQLANKAAKVIATSRLENHPCVVTVEEMAAARHFIRTQSHQVSEERRFALLQPQLEINPKHPIIKKLHHLIKSDPDLAKLLTKQLFANSMVGAGLVEDPRVLLTSMNELLTKALEKH